MATSLRKVASSCLDIEGGFSLGRDFFGYRHLRPEPISLRHQLALLRGPHIHLDIIIAGPGFFSTAQLKRIDHAIFGARKILSQVPLGIARIAYHEISDEEAIEYEVITKKRRAKQLTRRHRGSNDDAMDVFFVSEYSVSKRDGVLWGICNIAGCNKDLYAFNGCVLGTQLLIGDLAIRNLTAHEIGHGLRLPHRNKDGNLMQPGLLGTALTTRQKKRMLRDCFVQEGCRDA